MATSVSRNIASGNAIQINGPVAEKVIAVYCQTVIINNDQSISVNKSLTSTKAPAASSAPKLESSSPLSGKHIPALVEIDDQLVTALVNSISANANIRKENLILTSTLTKTRQPVYALYLPNLPISFIDRRIVRRLELETHHYDRAGKEASANYSKSLSTGDCVKLPYCPNKDDRCVTHRFRVVKHCCFDLVFGADSINPHHSESREDED